MERAKKGGPRRGKAQGNEDLDAISDFFFFVLVFFGGVSITHNQCSLEAEHLGSCAGLIQMPPN